MIIIIIINQALRIFYFYNYRFHANNYKFCQQFLLKRNLLIVCHVPNTADPCVLFEMPSFRFRSCQLLCRVLGAITVADRTVGTILCVLGFISCANLMDLAVSVRYSDQAIGWSTNESW